MHALASELVARLAWTSLQATVLIALVALLLRRWRLSAAMRSALWWLVGAQLLCGLLWSRPVAIPLLPTAMPAATALPANARGPVDTHAGVTARPPTPAAAPAPGGGRVVRPDAAPAPRPAWQPDWMLLLTGAWLAGLLAQAPRLIRQWRAAHRARRAAEPLADPALQRRCAEQAHGLGLRRCPALLRCAAIDSPQVSGLLRPAILLPARGDLAPADWELAVAHELAHLARHDLWLGWVPALAQRVFFFHPLVRRAMREYALNREAACDARVMCRHHRDVHAYGRLLLRLGVSHPLHAGLAGASPTFDNLKRRLIMLQQTVEDTAPRTRGWLLVALVALAGVLPYRVTAADPRVNPIPEARPAPAAPAASRTATGRPGARPATAPRAAAMPAARPALVAPPPPPPPPAVPAPPAPPAPPPAPATLGFAAHSHIILDSDAADAMALMTGDSTVFSGTEADLRRARRVDADGKPMLWFRRGGADYVVRDPATIARAHALYAPVDALAREQGRLGEQQGHLGARQGELGARQGELGARAAALAARRAQAGPADDAGTGTRADGDPAPADLAREQAELGRRQAALGQQQSTLARQQEALADRQQAAAARAHAGLIRLEAEVIASGKAVRTGDH